MVKCGSIFTHFLQARSTSINLCQQMAYWDAPSCWLEANWDSIPNWIHNLFRSSVDKFINVYWPLRVNIIFAQMIFVPLLRFCLNFQLQFIMLCSSEQLEWEPLIRSSFLNFQKPADHQNLNRRIPAFTRPVWTDWHLLIGAVAHFIVIECLDRSMNYAGFS